MKCLSACHMRKRSTPGTNCRSEIRKRERRRRRRRRGLRANLVNRSLVNRRGHTTSRRHISDVNLQCDAAPAQPQRHLLPHLADQRRGVRHQGLHRQREERQQITWQPRQQGQGWRRKGCGRRGDRRLDVPHSPAASILHLAVGSDSRASASKSAAMVDAATMEKLEAGFSKLQASDSKSLLKKYLTKEVFDNLKNKKTSFGSTLLDCIQSGVENLDSGVGIYAPDAESYSVFSDLFDPIIEDYHNGFKKTDKHPPKNWGDVETLGNLDPAGEFVVSTRVRCGRSMEGYPFNPCLTEAQYKEMEQKVSSTLSGLEGELKGTFFPLTGMSKETQQQLIDDHFLFKEGDRFLQAANACRFWPSGRGIYHNEAKTFLVWCNEEDHLRLISMQMGGDLKQVYKRLVTAVNDIEKRVPFSHHDRLGFLTFCPTNLGTTVRASVHIKLPKLAADKAKLEEVASKYHLQVRGTRGEHTEAEGGVYDISNKRRMGLTEYEAVKEMYDGIAELIKLEKSL